MKVVNRFVLGKLALEEALLGGVPNEGHIRILLTLGNGHIMMRVQERECTPLFTRIPIGVAAGFGPSTEGVFRALDSLPPRETLGIPHPHLPAPSTPVVPPEARPVLVRALTDLMRAGGTHADS